MANKIATQSGMQGLGAQHGSGASVEEGRRSQKHGLPGDRVHDGHMKSPGVGGRTHLSGAVDHLERQNKPGVYKQNKGSPSDHRRG